jgi:hypothetical protein
MKKTRKIEAKKFDMGALNRAFLEDLEVEVFESRYNEAGIFGDNGITVESNEVASNGESEWNVFMDEKEAESFALNLVKQDLEENPEYFVPNWLKNYLYITDTDKRLCANEEAESYYGDMSDEEIAEISEIDYEDYYDEDKDEYDDSKYEKDVDKARDELMNTYYEEVYDALDDPIEYFVRELGMYSMEDLFKQSFIRIDIDEASQNAIDVDGVAHFLDRYDGSEEEITDPETKQKFIVFGIN